MNNVTNAKYKPDAETTLNNDASTSEKTAQTKFLAMTEINRSDDAILHEHVQFTSGIFTTVFLKQTKSLRL